MNPKLKKTIIVLHISAIIYFLLGFFFLSFFLEFTRKPLFFLVSIPFIMLVLFFIGIGVFIEIIIKGLKDNKFWSWVASLIICGLYIPSLFIILGIIGLSGLLNKETRKNFLKSNSDDIVFKNKPKSKPENII